MPGPPTDPQADAAEQQRVSDVVRQALKVATADAEQILEKLKREKQNPKLADKPHPLTIRMGFVAPLITTLAVVVAIFSFGTSRKSLEVAERNMKVGQRAYPTIERGSIDFSSLVAASPLEITMSFRSKEPLRTGHINVSFDVTNPGNTPAQIVKGTLRPFLPDGWAINQNPTMATKIGTAREITIYGISSVAQKSTIHLDLAYNASLTGEAFSNYYHKNKRKGTFLGGIAGPIKIVAALEYKDVFDDPHRLDWCWYSNDETKWAMPCEVVDEKNDITILGPPELPVGVR